MQDNNYSLERRFFRHVVNGDFKNDTLFTGIIQAKVLAKSREIKGVGMQNFKHDEDVDAVFGLIHAISPRAYREIAKHIPLRSERSIKQVFLIYLGGTVTYRFIFRHKISQSPRFSIGIKEETFGYAKQYCEDYKYPQGAPLSLSVDDTKLHSALRPLYDGVKQKWFIVGTTEAPIEVPNAEALHETLDELEKTAELATKVSPTLSRLLDSVSYFHLVTPLGLANTIPWCSAPYACHNGYWIKSQGIATGRVATRPHEGLDLPWLPDLVQWRGWCLC